VFDPCSYGYVLRRPLQEDRRHRRAPRPSEQGYLGQLHCNPLKELKRSGVSERQGTVSGRSIVVAGKDQISADLTGEAAILGLKSGVYYGLDAVGTRIWDLLQEPKTVNGIRDAILEEYDVEPERCERDLLALFQELAAAGLIEVKDETSAYVAAPRTRGSSSAN
jgi:hypothetical protein